MKGTPTSGGAAATGAQGTYGIYAEMYRRAAKERGILPREIQSITWEAVRGLYLDTWKTKANKAKIDKLWEAYQKGDATLAQTRSALYAAAGKITTPSWAGSDSGPVEGRHHPHSVSDSLS